MATRPHLLGGLALTLLVSATTGGIGCGRPLGALRGDGAVEPAVDAGADAGRCVPRPELCNGRDDDCDGAIDEDGVCACADPLRLAVVSEARAPGPGDAADPALVWAGTDYGAVWTQGFARLDPVGGIVESHGSRSLLGSSSADLVYSATTSRFLFCWSVGVDVQCAAKRRGDATLEVVTAVDRAADGFAYNNPRLALDPDADRLAIVYPTGGGGGQLLDLQLVDAALLPVGAPVRVSGATARSIWDVAITWTGDGFAIAYLTAAGELRLGRYAPDGSPLAAEVSVSTLPDVEYLARTLLWDGAQYRIAWSDFDQVYYLAFRPSGEILAEAALTRYDDGRLVYRPALVRGRWLAAIWYTLRGNDIQRSPRLIELAILGDDGQPLRDRLVLSEQGLYPAIASNGDTYLVGWREGPDIWDPEIAFAHVACE